MSYLSWRARFGRKTNRLFASTHVSYPGETVCLDVFYRPILLKNSKTGEGEFFAEAELWQEAPFAFAHGRVGRSRSRYGQALVVPRIEGGPMPLVS